MMGAGVCWLDYNNDGWLNLYVVNSYTDDNLPAFQEARRPAGGAPSSGTTTGTVHERHRWSSGTGLQTRGEGCVAADLERRRLHRPLRHDLDERCAVLEQRRRHLHRGRPQGGRRLVRLALGRRRRRRERRRAARPLRGGLHRHAAPDPHRLRGRDSRGNYLGVRDLLFLNEGGAG